MQTITTEMTVGPVAEPLNLLHAKKQVELADNDTNHDDHLSRLIIAAREQWEHDTDSVLCFQTWRWKLATIEDGLQLPKRPVNAISSITYYDTGNVSRTLSSAVYQLDTANRQLRLAYGQTFPATVDRWDAWTITYKLGYGNDGTLVPMIAKQAMLLLIGHYFENRDMLIALGYRSMADSMTTVKAYEMLVRRYMRASYP